MVITIWKVNWTISSSKPYMGLEWLQSARLTGLVSHHLA